MAYRARSPVSIDHAPQWLAVIRIGVGLYFVKSLVTKMSLVLLGGFLPFPAVSDRWIHVMPTIVTKQASDNPIAVARCSNLALTSCCRLMSGFPENRNLLPVLMILKSATVAPSTRARSS